MKKPFASFCLALAILAVAVYGYQAWQENVFALSAQAANLATTIDAESAAAASRSTLDEVARDAATLQPYFVPQSGVVAFVNYLKTEGASLGTEIAVSSVAPARTVRPAFIIALTVTGSFDAVTRTVGAIEYAPYDLNVSKLSIDEGASGAWVATLMIEVGSTASSSPL